MRVSITLSGNAETGTGHVTDGSVNKIKQLTFENPLLTADILSDWIFALEMLYDEAVSEMQKDFDGTKAKQ
jgi:hypothetical protein